MPDPGCPRMVISELPALFTYIVHNNVERVVLVVLWSRATTIKILFEANNERYKQIKRKIPNLL